MRNNKLFVSLLTAIALSAITLLSIAAAKETEAPLVVSRIAPAPEHISLDRTITNLLSYYHYRRSKPDDKQSAAILDSYLSALDFSRSYFLQEDIDRFQKFRFSLDDYLRSGNLEPAYEIFNVYLQRLAERTSRLKEQLDDDIRFNIDETLELDREDQPWAKTNDEMDEIWRKRIKHELLTLMLASETLDEARETLKKRYDGRLRRTAQYKSQDVFQIYMNAVAASYDPHTTYFSPRATENFNIQMRLSLEGIGTVLRMEEEQITVVELVPGGPADLSDQLFPNDKIVGVGQGDNGEIVDVVGWRLDDVVELIRGRRSTVVRLDIIPANAGPQGGTKTIRLVRDTIQLEKQAAQSEIKTISGDMGEVHIGVITIPTFYSDFAAAQRGDRDYRSTTRDVRRILSDLQQQQIDGIVIDLRQNGGGSLQEAVELTGLFIEDGPVVQVRNSNGDIDVETDPDPTLVYDGPLAVLVNQFSASASEIFAGAMQDYGRALVLGAPTFGKGTVQTLVNLNRFVPDAETPLGQLKLTIAKFYRINGSSTQHRGVIPDIRFPSLYQDDEVGESAQEFALPWDEIKPVHYSAKQNLANIVPQLEQRHQQRTLNDRNYQLLLRDIEDAKKAQNNTVVSLLESKRRKEREEANVKRLERENEWRVSHGLKPIKQGDLDREDDDVDRPDPLIDESIHVLADMIGLLGGNSRSVVMQ